MYGCFIQNRCSCSYHVADMRREAHTRASLVGNMMFPQRPMNSYEVQTSISSRHQNPNRIRPQLRENWRDIRKTSCSPAYISTPSTAGSGISLAPRLSWKTHAYPGSSIFHPCYGNIDIGRRAADIGYVMMQLKQEPFYYYWQECASLPLPFLGGKYDLEATQRNPERTHS